MNREKMINKGKRMKRMLTLLTKLRLVKPRLASKERLVDTPYGNIRVLEYGLDSPETAPLYIDMHGGGFILGSADMDETMNLFFRENTNAKIISIDYPKAPENPYPIAVEAVYEIVRHYFDNATQYHIDPKRVGIGGHSAGANLAAAICIKAKETGDFSFKFQLLDYPPLDLHTNPFEKPKPKGAISPKMAAAFNACYVDEEMAVSPYASPVFASSEQLQGLPPALIIAAGHDSLHDEDIRYSEMLENAGVPVELHNFMEAAHGFTYNKTADSKRAHSIMADFICREFSK